MFQSQLLGYVINDGESLYKVVTLSCGLPVVVRIFGIEGKATLS